VKESCSCHSIIGTAKARVRRRAVLRAVCACRQTVSKARLLVAHERAAFLDSLRVCHIRPRCGWHSRPARPHVCDPLPHIADHVAEPQSVLRADRHGCRAQKAVCVRQRRCARKVSLPNVCPWLLRREMVDRDQRVLVPPWVRPVDKSATTGCFPFSFGRKAPAHCATVRHGIIPAHVHNRMLPEDVVERHSVDWKRWSAPRCEPGRCGSHHPPRGVLQARSAMANDLVLVLGVEDKALARFLGVCLVVGSTDERSKLRKFLSAHAPRVRMRE
jgi:hypothetical protein